MIKVFISHKQEDSYTANKIASQLNYMGIPYYLDVLDSTVTNSGKELTNHIKEKLNDCTDIIVVMSESTRYSQWVPFEVGMSAQKDMPTATFLKEDVDLPEFLNYWTRLKQVSDIVKYSAVRNDVKREYETGYVYEMFMHRQSQTERFYDVLKRRL